MKEGLLKKHVDHPVQRSSRSATRQSDVYSLEQDRSLVFEGLMQVEAAAAENPLAVVFRGLQAQHFGCQKPLQDMFLSLVAS